MQVRGRYTLSDGKMKYSLPVIPLRTFNIKDGSYLEFTGDPMKPTLKITATEEVRTSVSSGSGEGRIVDFECGVSLTKQFPKPGVEFIITAPDDQEMQNILNTKSVEERSKLAVTMLASGMYFDGDNSASANTAMSGALAGFLQTQVNSITGKALNSMGLDLTANMESAADVNGNLHTDYTFKFSKRLWNNRLRIIMGGRVSTGSQFSEDNGAYFDNFSLEYRLNQKETKYFKLYYEREAYDWLEGNLKDGQISKYPARAVNGTDQIIFINKEGKRFVREDGRRDQICGAVLNQTDKMFYILESGDGAGYKDIKDPEWRSGDGFTFEYLEKNGFIIYADTLEELAKKLDMDPATLQATVDEFNKSVESGSDEFGRTLYSTKLEHGPWVVTPRQACVHHTMGGVTIDPEARVLNDKGEPIKGLYAAGEITGGIHGANRLGGNAVVDTVVFGKLSADTLLADTK